MRILLLILIISPYLCFSQYWRQIGNDLLINENPHGEISINGEGDIIAVAMNNFYSIDTTKIKIFKYDKDNLSWNQLGNTLTQVGGQNSLSLNTKGDILAVGRNQLQIFKYNDVNQTWENTFNFSGACDNAQYGNNIGRSVSLSGDGNLVAVGDPACNIDNGVVRIFKYSDLGLWEEYDTIYGKEISGSTTTQLGFGTKVSLSKDGKFLGVLADHHNSNAKEVIMLKFSSLTNKFEQIGDYLYFKNFFDDNFHYVDDFSINQDGSIVVISANSLITEKGGIKTYRFENNNWIKFGEEIYGDETIGRRISLSYDGLKLVTGGNGGISSYEYKNESWNQFGNYINYDSIYDHPRIEPNVSFNETGTIMAINFTFNFSLSPFGAEAYELTYDYDDDGILDSLDNCPFISNSGQEHYNNNEIGDACGDPPPLFVENISFVKKVYPNPTNNELIVELKDNQKVEKVEFVDFSGKVITPNKVESNNSSISINVSNIIEGIFLLNITTDKEVNKVKIVIER